MEVPDLDIEACVFFFDNSTAGEMGGAIDLLKGIKETVVIFIARLADVTAYLEEVFNFP